MALSSIGLSVSVSVSGSGMSVGVRVGRCVGSVGDCVAMSGVVSGALTLKPAVVLTPTSAPVARSGRSLVGGRGERCYVASLAVVSVSLSSVAAVCSTCVLITEAS